MVHTYIYRTPLQLSVWMFAFPIPSMYGISTYMKSFLLMVNVLYNYNYHTMDPTVGGSEIPNNHLGSC